MKIYPLKLKPVAKSAIWGGTKIPELYSISEKGSSVAEAWMLTCRPDGVNIIENGDYAGMELGDYIEKVGADKIYGTGEFPLLIKIIDAADKLSVQVHPDDSYAHSHGLDAGKTEMWYILDAEPGSMLVSGIKPGITAQMLADSAESGECEKYLSFTPVKKGDCFYIPAGLVHAIGGGILIAEIQQNSNTTYRLYDYNRRDKDGNLRELHVKSASEVIKTDFDLSGTTVNKEISCANGIRITILCECEFFSAKKIEIAGEKSTDLSAGEHMIHLMCTEGCGHIEYNGSSYALKKGDSYLLPKCISDCRITADSNLEIIISK